MKLKAPPGVGEPCVAGVALALRDGLYEVEAEIGALLIETFGFGEVAANPQPAAPSAQRPARRTSGRTNADRARRSKEQKALPQGKE